MLKMLFGKQMVIAIVVLLLVIGVLVFKNQRLENAIQKEELEQAEAETRFIGSENEILRQSIIFGEELDSDSDVTSIYCQLCKRGEATEGCESCQQ